MGNRRQLTRQLGHSGLDRAGGLQSRGWGELGDEFLAEWRGAYEKSKRVTEMLSNSPIIGGAMRTAIELPILDIEWQWTSDTSDNDPRLALVTESWQRLDWRHHLIEALTFVFYGWSTFSVAYEPVDGRWQWKRFKFLGQETVQRWHIDGDEITALQQWPHLWPDPIPAERMVHYRWRAIKNNPEGMSILRPAWVPWYYVKNLQQVEAIGLERNLAGLPVIMLPEGADTTETDSDNTDYGRALRVVRNIRQDEQAGLVMPYGWEIQLLSASGRGKAAETDMVLDRYNKQILMSALAQFLALGMENVGALATFEGANDFFTLAVNAVADIIGETFTKQAGERLLRLNGLDPKGITLEHAPAGNVAADKLVSALQMADARVTWTADDEVWLRDLLRMPHKETEEITQLREEEAQRKFEQAQQFARRLGGNQEGQEQEPHQPGEMMTAEWYGAAVDPVRDAYEREYQRRMDRFLTEQQKRLLTAARE